MRWTENDIVFLKNNYKFMTCKEIALQLGRTYKSIENKKYQLGLKLTTEDKFKRVRVIGRDQTGKNNPNWKGGISKNNYHYKKLQIERYPERVKARTLLYYAMRKGILIKQPCEICGTTKNIQAHHEDYSKPLEVVWLCRKCHRELHRRLKTKNQ